MTPLALVRSGHTRLDKNELNMDSSDNIGGYDVNGGNIKNLSTIEKSAKSKNLDFANAKSSEADFLTSEVKKAFIYLRKAFTKALILYYFDIKRYIHIKTNVLGYTIGRILSQMISDQRFFDYITHKDLDSSKSEIG